MTQTILNFQANFVLIFFKLTIAPEMSWGLVFTPIIVSFIYGFIKGASDSQREKYKK